MSDFNFIYSRGRFWFLFEKEGKKYLSCQYDRSVVTFFLFIQLTEGEVLRLENRGYEYIDDLVMDIRRCPENFENRNLGEAMDRAAMKSIHSILPGD